MRDVPEPKPIYGLCKHCQHWGKLVYGRHVCLPCYVMGWR